MFTGNGQFTDFHGLLILTRTGLLVCWWPCTQMSLHSVPNKYMYCAVRKGFCRRHFILIKKKVHVFTKWCWLGCICWAVMISFWEAVWLCCYCVQRLTTADRIKHYKLGLLLFIFCNHSLWFMSIFVNICGSVDAVIISFLHAAMSRKNSFEVNGSYGLQLL